MSNFIDAVFWCAQVGKCKRMSRLVQYLLERGVAIDELPLQRAGSHAQDFGHFLLRRFPIRQPQRHDFAYARLYIVAFDPRKILSRDGVALSGKFGIAGVKTTLDALAVEYQAVLLGAES